ncbi:tetratricopeptide repeat protein [uncultured Sunxiuqinia sp.]|uniref:tetratricopeptide repeat protein n=1 Tax=uncultured Sunxiuqinia sp. TaxID=1573825 RepID=UPI0030DAC09C
MKKLIGTIVMIGCLWSLSGQTPEVLKSDGISAETQEQYEAAAQAFEAAAKAFQAQNIVDTVCIYHAGANYARIDQHEKAIPFLQECIELKYNEGKASRLLSDAFFSLKDVEKAETVLLKGKSSVPEEEFEFDKKLAYLYFNSGQYEKSAEVLETVITQAPQNKNYLYLYGFSLERIKKYKEAMAVFEEMQQLFPGDKRARKMRGIVLFELTDERNTREVENYESNKNAKLEDYITTKKRLENINAGYEKARLLLEESLKDYPNDKQIIHTLYKTYKKQFKEEEAAKMKSRL